MISHADTRISAVLTDVDGTLVTKDKVLTARALGLQAEGLEGGDQAVATERDAEPGDTGRREVAAGDLIGE